MSAFHPVATKLRTQFYVGFVPTADALLFEEAPFDPTLVTDLLETRAWL
jgi:hypothetical protein